jgi:hypothetical protein
MNMSANMNTTMNMNTNSTNTSLGTTQPNATASEAFPRTRKLATVRRPAPQTSRAPTWVYLEIPRQPVIERPEDAPRVPSPRISLAPQEPGYTDEDFLIWCGERDEYDAPYREISEATVAHEEAEKPAKRRRQRERGQACQRRRCYRG